MISLILSASLVFLSTSIDYLVLFIVLFSQVQTKKDKRAIYIGHYLGIVTIVAVSLIGAHFLQFVPQTWMIGLLGIIPIYQGIETVRGHIKDAEEEVDRILSDRFSLWLDVFLMTVILSGDNFGIFPPYLAQWTSNERLLIFIVFSIGVYFLCKLADTLSKTQIIRQVIVDYERITVPAVLIGLGFYILWSNGTIQYIHQYFLR